MGSIHVKKIFCNTFPLTDRIVADPGVALPVPQILALHVVEPGVGPDKMFLRLDH